jgi:hypothetical protein
MSHPYLPLYASSAMHAAAVRNSLMAAIAYVTGPSFTP